MQLIVNIDKEVYKAIKSPLDSGGYYDSKCYDAIWNGVPLPENHGRLIDADELKKKYPHDTDWDYPVNTNSYVVKSIDDAETIIEANRE